MNNDVKLLELIEWLKGEKYLIDEHSDTMTGEFEREHKYELSRNIMINKVIKKIEEMLEQHVKPKSINGVITIEMLEDLSEKLKPKNIIYTNNEDIYKVLLQLPYTNKDNVKLTNWADGVIIVDIDKMREATLKPYPYTII